MIGLIAAALVSVAGPNSSEGFAPQIIAAPASAEDGATVLPYMAGFDETQSVFLTEDILTDQGSIAAGTWVSSHMIFMDGAGSLVTQGPVTWTFSGKVLGTQSDIDGALETQAAAAVLRAASTLYPGAPFLARGIEPDDALAVGLNTVTLTMLVREPGDWVRVITEAPEIPAPAAAWLMLAGLAGFGFAARGRRA